MNDVYPAYQQEPDAFFSRCEDCGKYHPEEMVTLVDFKDFQMELCQECTAIWRENGKVMEFPLV